MWSFVTQPAAELRDPLPKRPRHFIVLARGRGGGGGRRRAAPPPPGPGWGPLLSARGPAVGTWWRPRRSEPSGAAWPPSRGRPAVSGERAGRGRERGGPACGGSGGRWGLGRAPPPPPALCGGPCPPCGRGKFGLRLARRAGWAAAAANGTCVGWRGASRLLPCFRPNASKVKQQQKGRCKKKTKLEENGPFRLSS